MLGASGSASCRMQWSYTSLKKKEERERERERWSEREREREMAVKHGQRTVSFVTIGTCKPCEVFTLVKISPSIFSYK